MFEKPFNDFFQFECCGVAGPDDWILNGGIPNSCCPDSSPQCDAKMAYSSVSKIFNMIDMFATIKILVKNDLHTMNLM